MSSTPRPSLGDGGVRRETGLAGAEPPKVMFGMSLSSTSSMLLMVMRSRAGESRCLASRAYGKVLWVRSMGRFRSKL